MKPLSLLSVLCFASLFFSACHSNQSGGNHSAHAGIAEDRANISAAPVASMKQKVADPLNDWYFKVDLYETGKTFNYLVKMQYEEVKGEDTIHFPDFGIDPQPVFREGKDSCIIGFLDQEKKFRPYKLVSVKDGQLSLTTLNHYAVYAVPVK